MTSLTAKIIGITSLFAAPIFFVLKFVAWMHSLGL